jgi:hypothetical protein
VSDRPRVGDLVCTCRMEHVRIIEVEDDGDTILTEDGWQCSYTHCCDEVDHSWSHEDVTRAANMNGGR